MSESVRMLASQPEVLVEFRAGKMTMTGTTVRPDTRKGSFRIIKSPEDQLLHVQWLDRSSGDVEEDQIVFPDEAEFSQVGQPKARVFLLNFKTDNRKLFFWMQEPSTDRDGIVCAEVNRLLTDASYLEDIEVAAELMDVAEIEEEDEEVEESEQGHGGGGGRRDATGRSGEEGPKSADVGRCGANNGSQETASESGRVTGGTDGGVAGSGGSGVGASKMEAEVGENRPGNALDVSDSVGQQAARHGPQASTTGHQQTPGAAASVPPFSPSAVASAFSDAQLAAMRTILAGLGNIPVPHGGAAEAFGPGLQDLLRPGVMLPWVEREEVREALKQHLPQALHSTSAMRELVQSPQFTQQLETFTQVLRSGDMDLTQFGIDPTKYGFSIPSFLQAIQDQVEEQKKGSDQEDKPRRE